MRDSRSQHQRLFAEMKRRRVFRVMAVYGVVAFVLLQVADLVSEPLGLPDWTMTLVVLLAMLGFPVAIVLAWAFEMTPEGVRKTEGASWEEIEAIAAQPASKRWPSGLLALVGVVALVFGAWWIGRKSAPGVDGGAAGDSTVGNVRLALSESEDVRPSLAVLPFLDMSPEGDEAYFSDGMTEEIINTLVKVRDLKVAARTSAFAFRGRDLDMRTIGDSLGVEYLIEGSVRKAGDQLRITAQLIDAADGTHLWSESYDRTMDDVFAIQKEIAASIAGELRVPLGLDDAAELVTPTADMQAYDLYLGARARMRERGESLREAIRLFEAAIARDSDWAPAWAGLAGALEVTGWESNWAAWGEVPTDRAAQRAIQEDYWDGAERAARRAIELDPDNGPAHVALGSVLRNRREWGASEAAYLRALATDPDNAEAYQQYSQLLFFTGRLAESVRVGRRAVELDRAPVRLMMLSIPLMLAGRYEEAIEVLDDGLRLDPYGPLAESISAGKTQLVALSLRTSRQFEALGDSIRAWGAPSELVDAVVDALRSGNVDDLSPELLQEAPWVLILFGTHEQAAEGLLEFAREEPLGALFYIWLPVLDPIRQQPAYLEALRVLDLEGRTPQRGLQEGPNSR